MDDGSIHECMACRGPAAFTNFPANHYASVSTRNEPVKGRAGLGVKDRRFMGVAWCPPSHQFEARIWTRYVSSRGPKNPQCTSYLLRTAMI